MQPALAVLHLVRQHRQKLKQTVDQFLPCDAMQAQPTASCSISCLCVMLVDSCHVMFVDSVETSNHIFKTFSPSGSLTISVFLYQTLLQYSDNDPLMGMSSANGVGKIAILKE